LPYRIDVPAGGEMALDVLIDLGALDVERLPDGRVAAIVPDGLAPERVASALHVDRVLVSAAIDRDAGSVWIVRSQPIRVGRLTIAPAEAQRGPRVLRLIDAPAFGTGRHPTTVLCLELLDEAIANLHAADVLDVGTGSGVLALAMLTLGVPRATAVDVDAAAVYVARGNARLNGLDERLILVCGGPEAVRGAWPLVVANILAAPLVEMAPTLVRRVASRGRLVLSGIASPMGEDVSRAYCNFGMRLLEIRSRGGWDAIVLDASW
jgi:ribosomal protein L11 methyltransferase